MKKLNDYDDLKENKLDIRISINRSYISNLDEFIKKNGIRSRKSFLEMIVNKYINNLKEE